MGKGAWFVGKVVVLLSLADWLDFEDTCSWSSSVAIGWDPKFRTGVSRVGSREFSLLLPLLKCTDRAGGIGTNEVFEDLEIITYSPRGQS